MKTREQSFASLFTETKRALEDTFLRRDEVAQALTETYLMMSVSKDPEIKSMCGKVLRHIDFMNKTLYPHMDKEIEKYIESVNTRSIMSITSYMVSIRMTQIEDDIDLGHLMRDMNLLIRIHEVTQQLLNVVKPKELVEAI